MQSQRYGTQTELVFRNWHNFNTMSLEYNDRHDPKMKDYINLFAI